MIAIIDYDAGNVKSVQNALKKLGFEAVITSDIETIKNADKVIFPGVGEASSAMKKLQERGLDAVIPNLKQPVLGICLGMQLMCNASEEGNTKALGIFDCEVKLFPNSDIVPHMGWNNVSEMKGKLLENISETDNFYFVHSYYAEFVKVQVRFAIILRLSVQLWKKIISTQLNFTQKNLEMLVLNY
jgi:glutamine amidotransferase